MGRRNGHIQMIVHYFNFEFFERWRKFYGFSREAVSTQIGHKSSYLTWCMRNDRISAEALNKLLIFMEKTERTNPIKILKTYYSDAFVNDRVIDRYYFHEPDEDKGGLRNDPYKILL